MVERIERYAAQYGRLRRLVVGLDVLRRHPVQHLPVAAEELTEAEGVGARAGRAVEAGFEDRLRQADVSGDAEALVDQAPLAEERPVLGHVRQQEQPARGVVQQRPDGGLEPPHHFVAPIVQANRERAAAERGRHRRVHPQAVLQPVAPLRGEGDHQPPVLGAAEGNAAIVDGEDVLPERIGRPKRLDDREVRLQARLHRTRGLRRYGKAVRDAEEGDEKNAGERSARIHGTSVNVSAVRVRSSREFAQKTRPSVGLPGVALAKAGGPETQDPRLKTQDSGHSIEAPRQRAKGRSSRTASVETSFAISSRPVSVTAKTSDSATATDRPARRVRPRASSRPVPAGT